MKKRIEKFFKDIVIIWAVICTLLSTIFTGFVAATDEGKLNTERAGNFAANFAINFYENWSSQSMVNEDGVTKSSGVVNGNYNFVWPLKEGTYSSSSSFGLRVWDDGSVENHKGIDFSAPMGTPVYASASGKIVNLYNGCPHNFPKNSSCGCGGGYGNNIIIESDSGVLMVYGHLTNVEKSLSIGDTVAQGQLIGTVGTTGWSTAAHLHFEFVTNDVSGIRDNGKIIDRVTPFYGYRYSVDPSLYIGDDAKITAVLSGSSMITRGQIKTSYDENKNIYELVDEDASTYEFNNKSWINFVFYKSLFKDDVNKVFSGTGTTAVLNASHADDNAIFDDKYATPGVKDIAKESPILDISELISEGKVLPGDVLYVYKGQKDESTPAEYEYLLYVGGSKVIYATNDEKVAPSGALKYEYLEYYLRRIRNDLREGHEDDENFEMPKYGVMEVYRIKPKVAETINEGDANLIFNGKGYYSRVKYQGVPDVKLYETRTNVFKWIFGYLLQLLELLFNIMIYAIRMQIIGWANLFENLLQHVLLGITGDNSSTSSDGFFGTTATSESGERITVESIFFNQIPILDANFFNFESAGGHSLLVEQEIVGPLLQGQERIQKIPDSDNVAYRLRKNLATIYIVFRNIAIAIMLFVLIAVGIKIALSSIAEKKAEFKQFLTSWVYALIVILLMHFFMYTMFSVNDTFVGICRDWNKKAAKQTVSQMVEDKKPTEEMSLYDAIRTKAYAFNWKEGVPATIVYIFLVYLLIRFSFIYFKRYLTIYILALSAPFMGVKYAIDRLLGKKAKNNSLNKWFKDFAFNVLLQTVHAFIYTIFMAIAISVSATSVAGALIAVVILNFMLQADKMVIKIFGLDKAGSLADVNTPESFRDLFRKFLPIYTISAGALGLGKRAVFSNDGFIRRGLDNFFASGAANRKDANKIWEMRKYKLIGDITTILDMPFRGLRHIPKVGGVFQSLDSHLPIRHLRMLRQDLSYDTKKNYYKEIKGYVGQTTGRFTRKIGLAKDLTLGSAGTVASLGVMIADPEAGIALLAGSRKMINKHKSISSLQMKKQRYSGTKKAAKDIRKKAKENYKETLKTYVDNEMGYQEKYNRLLDDYANASSDADKNDVMEKIRQLRKERRKEISVEMHKLQEATEELDEAKFGYGNAKHELNGHKILRHDKRVREKVTGQNALENIVMSDTRESYDAWDKATKAGKKLDAMEKAAKQEIELRKLTREFKDAIKNMTEDGNRLTEQEVNERFNDAMSRMVKQASSQSVKSGYVTKAINSRLYEKNSDKVEVSDIDGIIDKIQTKLDEANKHIRITDSERQKIKNALEKKMISDNKGLGLEDKDAAEVIRKVLGSETKLKDSSRVSDSSKITAIQNQLFKKMVEINTANQVGNIKHKSSLINFNKAVKDAKKSGK